MRILFFGDSVIQGLWDVEQGGWVQRLRQQYDESFMKNRAGDSRIFFNLGVDANTTSDVVKRMSNEIEMRRFHDDPFALIFGVGLNDSTFAGKEIMATPEQYHDELKVLITGARRYSERILFVGLTPVDDTLCNPWIYSSTGKAWKNQRVLDFEEVLRKICIDEKIPHVQVFEKFQAEQQNRELLSDGLHPNDAGHQLIADLVKPALDKLLAQDVLV